MSDIKVIAVKECANGNASVGTEWLETKIFDKETPVIDIIRWGTDKGDGRLMITTDDSDDVNF